jgi:hypothetical protein
MCPTQGRGTCCRGSAGDLHADLGSELAGDGELDALLARADHDDAGPCAVEVVFEDHDAGAQQPRPLRRREVR